jgi:hypothetical protein
MPTAEQIFDKTYSYGTVSIDERSVLRSSFIAAVDGFLSLPVTSVFEFNSPEFTAVFVTFSYVISNPEMATLTCDMLVIEQGGNLRRFREQLLVSLASSDPADILRALARKRNAWAKRFSPQTVDRYKHNSKPRPGTKRDSYTQEDSLSLTPFEKSRFFNYQSNANLYRELVAPYAHLTKRGSTKKREQNGRVDPERLPRVFIPALTAMARPFWAFRRKYLRSELLATLASLGVGQLTCYYNWLNADGDKLRSLRRQQAARAFPILFEEIYGKENLSQAVDSGVELIPVLASHFSASAAVIRFLRGKTNQMLGARHSSIDWLIKDKISIIPIDQMPRRKNEWNFLRGISSCYVKSALKTGFPALVKLSKDRNLNGSSFSSLVRDYHTALGIRTQPDCTALPQFHSSVAFKRWIEVSDKFHAKRVAIAAQLSNKIVEARRAANIVDTWEPLVSSGVIALRSVSISFLTSIEALEAEAKIMEHCVDGYGEDCLFYGAHIASVYFHDGTDRHRSTAQFGFHGKTLEVIQHFAKKNTGPHLDLEKAVNSFVKGVNSGKIAVDREALELSREGRRDSLAPFKKQMKMIEAERTQAYKNLALALLPPAAKQPLGKAMESQERFLPTFQL